MKKTKNFMNLLTLSLCSLILFFIILINLNTKFFSKIDLFFNSNIHLIYNSFLTKLMIFFSFTANPLPFFILSLTVFLILFYKRKKDSFLFAFLIAGGFILKILIKNLIQRPRPINSLISVSGYSFPSGHALMSIIFFTSLIYFFKDKIKNKNLKYLFIMINILFFLLVGFSRIYLNVHWFTDVLGGFLLGLIWFAFSLLIFNFLRKRK